MLLEGVGGQRLRPYLKAWGVKLQMTNKGRGGEGGVGAEGLQTGITKQDMLSMDSTYFTARAGQVGSSFFFQLFVLRLQNLGKNS